MRHEHLGSSCGLALFLVPLSVHGGGASLTMCDLVSVCMHRPAWSSLYAKHRTALRSAAHAHQLCAAEVEHSLHSAAGSTGRLHRWSGCWRVFRPRPAVSQAELPAPQVMPFVSCHSLEVLATLLACIACHRSTVMAEINTSGSFLLCKQVWMACTGAPVRVEMGHWRPEATAAGRTPHPPVAQPAHLVRAHTIYEPLLHCRQQSSRPVL